MGQKKLIRFAELNTFPNVLQYPENMPGKWKDFFKNQHPITLELACGKGEYALGLSKQYPQRNFIGVDVKGNRIWVGAKTALKEQRSNVVFLRTQIDRIANYFTAGEVEEIWLTFPDPQLRSSRLRKRLTHPNFLRKYQSILRADGLIHLKTDSPVLYRFTKMVIELYQLPLVTDIDDVYLLNPVPEELSIRTHYEALDIAGSNRIHYLCFRLPATTLAFETDTILKEKVFEMEKV
ncbi:MAG: tRNA (guanosine(46)-N7)-methyltransferase TrmB [Chitinophagaceae bacterium]